MFCDVALPVPLERLFTYAVKGVVPAVGARVLVPFGGQRLMGVVMRVHGEAPAVGIEVKDVQTVMDTGALLSDEQMGLARWIAAYYCAPLGEVIRGMLPLSAEVKRQFTYRIGEQGRKVLYEGAAKGSSRRSKLTAEEQNREYSVLNYLESGEAAKAGALRSATGAGRGLLEGMVKKKWLVREALAEERDAKRVVKVAVLCEPADAGEGNAGPSTSLRSAQDDRLGEGGDRAVGSIPHPFDVAERMGQPKAEVVQSRSQSRDLGHPEIAGSRLPRLNENQLAVMAELASVGGRAGGAGSAGPAGAG